MSKFHNKFLKILKEAPQLDIDPTLERDAAEMSLDDGVSMDDYDTDMEPDPNAIDEVGDAVARQNEQQATLIDNWSSNIDKFLNYLNGDSPNSIQSLLAKANDETVVGALKNQQTKIGRIASDLAALQQAFLTAKKSQ
jgi:hypothetical protein